MGTIHALDHQGEDGLAVLAFKVQALQFDLNRDLKYISMKDQLIRARTLVLAACRAGLIGPQIILEKDEANVVVIGAGVGGVSAALMACELGLSVKLVEANTNCFPLLGLGSDRLFSATIYDWPHAHSASHAFPYIDALRDAATAKQLRAGAAALRFPGHPVAGKQLRADFISQLSHFQSAYGNALEVLCEHRLLSMSDVAINEPSNRVWVHLHVGNQKKLLRGQIVIFALGFGLESDGQQTAAARSFFSYATLKADVAKASKANGGGLVRVIGAGDGGLQEALRFVLDDAWHDLHSCIRRLEQILRDAGHADVWTQICSRLQSAEDQAVRSSMWGYTDEFVYRELDAIYEGEVERLLHVAAPSVDHWVQNVVRRARFKVQLVDNVTYSAKAYGLNRWLAALLRRVGASSADHVTLERVTPSQAVGQPDVLLRRAGFAGSAKQGQIGTAAGDDLLRRLAFQGVPMNLDAVV